MDEKLKMLIENGDLDYFIIDSEGDDETKYQIHCTCLMESLDKEKELKAKLHWMDEKSREEIVEYLKNTPSYVGTIEKLSLTQIVWKHRNIIIPCFEDGLCTSFYFNHWIPL